MQTRATNADTCRECRHVEQMQFEVERNHHVPVINRSTGKAFTYVKHTLLKQSLGVKSIFQHIYVRARQGVF